MSVTRIGSDKGSDQGTAGWQLPLLVVLFVSSIYVAIQAVVHRHNSRTLFMELQTLEKQRDKLAAQWSRLKLEQGTLLNQVSVEHQARWDLDMHIPKASEVKIVREKKIVGEKLLAKNQDVSSKVVLSE